MLGIDFDSRQILLLTNALISVQCIMRVIKDQNIKFLAAKIFLSVYGKTTAVLKN